MISRNFSPGLLALLALAVAVRSLVAPGFMLVTDVDGHGSPRIVVCHGPNGINAIPGFSTVREHAGWPADDQAGRHFTAVCGLWNAGALYVSDFGYLVTNCQPDPGLGPVVLPRTAQARPGIDTQQLIRAPPLSFSAIS